MDTLSTNEPLASGRLLHLPIPAPLQPFVDNVWVLAAQHGTPPQPVIADGAVDLIVRLGAPVQPITASPLASRMRHGETPAYVLGPRLLPVFVQLMPATLLVGMRFCPGGAYPFFGTSLAELTDGAVSLDDLWRAPDLPTPTEYTDAKELLHALTLALLARLPRAAAPHPSVVAATAMLKASGGRTPVHVVARQVGLSERQLERLFHSQVGLTPKALARVVRVQQAQKALFQAPRYTLAEIALQAGFADQAHFTREYTALVGTPPGWHQRTAGTPT